MIFKTYISEKDVKKFAITSFDKNPLHINNKIARRQFFGVRISHGALLIEKFIIYFFKKKKYIINKFECYFIRPCEINSTITYKYLYKNSKVKCDIFLRNRKICFFEFSFEKNSLNEKIQNKRIQSKKINKFSNIMKLKNISKNKIKFIKTYDNKKNIFLNILYNLSRIIGTEIPGYYSLFSNFQLTFNNQNELNNNYYKISNVIKKLNLIETSYFFKKYNLTSNSFLLKPPLNFEKSFKNRYFLNKKILSKNKKILIIGGSRGLGLMSTYYFLSRGYKVYSTYSVFNDFLKNIKNRNLSILNYDINGNHNLKKITTIAEKSDYLMFFASPKILDQRDKYFNKEYFNLFNKYNNAFIKIIENLKSRKKIFFPSTVFLNSKGSRNFLEYSKSKYLMENFFKMNKAKYISYIPRLPRFATDQNNFNLTHAKIVNILDFEKYLKEFEKK